MSNSHLFLKSGFLRVPLHNGVGRYVCQLQRVTIKFCKSHGDSRGVREFIEQDLIDFARQNPGIVMYLKPRRHRAPAMVAEYLNGDIDYMNLHNYSRDEVIKWLEYMRKKSGNNIRWRKPQSTTTPSIQGVWTPWTHKPPSLNLAKFPNEDLSCSIKTKLTTTDLVRKAFESQLKGEPVPSPVPSELRQGEKIIN